MLIQTSVLEPKNGVTLTLCRSALTEFITHGGNPLASSTLKMNGWCRESNAFFVSMKSAYMLPRLFSTDP